MRNWVGENPGFKCQQDVPIMPTESQAGNWGEKKVCRRREEQFNKAKMSKWEKCLGQKPKFNHPAAQVIGTLAPARTLEEDGGSGSAEITFVSLRLAQYGVMKLF